MNVQEKEQKDFSKVVEKDHSVLLKEFANNSPSFTPEVDEPVIEPVDQIKEEVEEISDNQEENNEE